MRRFDREVIDIEEIESLILQCSIVRLGLVENNKAYIVPMNYGYQRDGEALTFYLHSAPVGRKIELLKEVESITFEMDEALTIHEDEVRCSTTTEYISVMGEGRVRFVEAIDEKKRGLDLLLERYGFEGPFSFNESVFNRVCVFKIEVTSITGKKNPRHKHQ